MSKKDCDGCKFWSERCAQSIGGGPMEALCLNQESPRRGKMVHSGCDKYAPGRAIDDPISGNAYDEMHDSLNNTPDDDCEPPDFYNLSRNSCDRCGRSLEIDEGELCELCIEFLRSKAMADNISERAKRLAVKIIGYKHAFPLNLADTPTISQLIQDALDAEAAERPLESKLHEAFGKARVLTYAEPQTHEDAAKHLELVERFRAGERSPELLAEIEGLTARLTEEAS